MKNKNYLIKLIIIIVGVAIDLITKTIFANIFATPREEISVIDNFFYFTYLENTGAAYGIFSGNTIMLAVFSIIFIIAFAVYDYFNHEKSWTYIGGVSLIISGAIGNLIDRLFLGYVRDFISIRLFSFVFNIADLWVTVGVILFVVNLIISIFKDKKVKVNVENNK